MGDRGLRRRAVGARYLGAAHPALPPKRSLKEKHSAKGTSEFDAQLTARGRPTYHAASFPRKALCDAFIKLWRALVAASSDRKARCPRCKCRLKHVHRPKRRGAPRTAHPDNASPDCVDNTLDDLAPGNVEIVCVTRPEQRLMETREQGRRLAQAVGEGELVC